MNVENVGLAVQFWGMVHHKYGSLTRNTKVLPVLAAAVAVAVAAVAAAAAGALVSGACFFHFAAASCMLWCFGEHAGGKCDSGLQLPVRPHIGANAMQGVKTPLVLQIERAGA